MNPLVTFLFCNRILPSLQYCYSILGVGSSNRNYLLDGLEQIKTKGYDGAGIATMASTGGTMVCLSLSQSTT